MANADANAEKNGPPTFNEQTHYVPKRIIITVSAHFDQIRKSRMTTAENAPDIPGVCQR